MKLLLALAIALLSTTAHAAADPVCRDAYEKLYKKSQIDVRVVFGYKDARPARFVGDRHERIAFVQRITSPCKKDQNACGFERTPHNADLFQKTIETPRGKKVVVNLRVVHSSTGSDDAANRTDPFQNWQSTYAKKIYLTGLGKADVVLYNGHSRFGGGPDFDPPKLLKNGEIHTAYYKKLRPGLTSTLREFKNRPKSQSLKVFGMFSCESSQHFTEEIRKRSATALITSRGLIYYADALENSLGALSSLLASRCESKFKSSIQHGSSEARSELTGFFR